MTDRLLRAFTEHPASVGESYWQHLAFASGFAARLLLAGLAALVHALLPMPGGKRDSDWGYAWIPVVGPLVGATLAGLLYLLLQDPTSVHFR